MDAEEEGAACSGREKATLTEEKGDLKKLREGNDLAISGVFFITWAPSIDAVSVPNIATNKIDSITSAVGPIIDPGLVLYIGVVLRDHG